MPGSFDYDPGSLPLYGDSLLVQVYRYDPDADADDRYTLVPNVRCESIQYKEGAEPSSAQFAYILDDSTPSDREADDPYNSDGWPTEFEALWPIGGQASEYALTPTDRIVVLGTTGRSADGSGPGDAAGALGRLPAAAAVRRVGDLAARHLRGRGRRGAVLGLADLPAAPA
jgi:hypothetical protein